MRTSIIIILILLTKVLVSQTDNDSVVTAARKNIVNKDVMTIANQHSIKLKAIETIMVKQVFEQSCVPTIPKKVGTADVSFIKSKVGIVTSCFYLKNLRNDTLKSVYMMTDNQKNTEQLLKQATKQYGQPKISNDGFYTLYSWDNTQKNCIATISLLIDDKKKGVLDVRQK
jgi:hypothetical protein